MQVSEPTSGIAVARPRPRPRPTEPCHSSLALALALALALLALSGPSPTGSRPYLPTMKSFATAVLLALLLVARLAAQQADPAGSYRTVESAHFRVTYSAELDSISVLAVERAEEAYDLLQ